MDEKQKVMRLSAALVEALVHLYIVGKAPPYVVPCQIDGDRWQFKIARSAVVATKVIKKAVGQAAK